MYQWPRRLGLFLPACGLFIIVIMQKKKSGSEPHRMTTKAAFLDARLVQSLSIIIAAEHRA
jgi:hypothetical protein